MVQRSILRFPNSRNATRPAGTPRNIPRPQGPTREIQRERFSTTFDRLSETLNRQILSQLSRSLFDTQLGDELQEGSFTFGSLALEIYESSEGLIVNILDTDSGEQTQIIVPN